MLRKSKFFFEIIFKNSLFIIERVETYSNPLYANLSMKLFRNNKGISLMNVSSELYVNMTKMVVKFLILLNIQLVLQIPSLFYRF